MSAQEVVSGTDTTCSPYLRTRKIDGGAVALVRMPDTFTVNVWTEDDDTFRDGLIDDHDNSPAARLRALATAREFYRHVLETGIGARDLVDVLEPAA